MKWLLTIWTFYLTMLTAMPCGDARNHCNDSGSKAITTQSHNHHQDSDDNCSPFCHCSCCSISIASLDFKPFEIRQPRLVFAARKIMLYDETIISGHNGNIWNPPKFTI